MKITKNHIPLVNHILSLIYDNPKITLEELSAQTDISPAYIQKMCKEVTGLSPKEYASSLQYNHFVELLENNESTITQAIYDSGYESTSRVYEKSNQLLGMTPTQYKDKTYSQNIIVAIGECSLGSVLVAQTNKGICAINLGSSPESLMNELQDRFPKAQFLIGNKNFEDTVAKIIGLIEEPHKNILLDFPLDIQGTLFQKKVWKVLKEIPIGKTVTYSELAQMIDSPKSVRAVASACANNNIAILIPCHRVVRKGGDLAGYRWGIERKEKILNKEKGKNHI